MDRGSLARGGSTRRDFLIRAGGGVAALKITTAFGLLTPAEARAQRAPLRFFTQDEADALGALAEVLVPGSREAGVVNFVDAQLVADESKLLLRYLDWPPPLGDFYRGSLAALDAAGAAEHGSRFAACTPEQQVGLVVAMATGTLADWIGPPAPLFYFVARSDAVDAYYGTVDGFARLNVPYMPHILPTERW